MNNEILLQEYYYGTKPKTDLNIQMYVCESSADLHFINKAGETIHIIRNNEY
jgi:hypothetical protein